MDEPRSWDDAEWARELGVSTDAVALYRASDVIDLHLDSFIWTRVFGYDLGARNGPRSFAQRLFGRRFFGQTDFPRAIEAGLTGGTWIITTNPFKSARRRRDAFFENLERITSVFEDARNRFALVTNAAEYRRARADGLHGAFLGIQGGNALDFDLDDLERLGQRILRITLVHLTNSRLGATSAPYGRFMNRGDGLTDLGREYVRRSNAQRIFVDLAHISRKAFFDAVAVHDSSQPLMVTHTGVSGVYEHWRNVTDEQLRAIADTGGTIGVMFQESFLGREGVSCGTVVDHLQHIIDVVGEDHASIGSDYDGAIVPPSDLATPFELPRLVQTMLDRGFGETRIQKILGGNFLRVVAALRG